MEKSLQGSDSKEENNLPSSFSLSRSRGLQDGLRKSELVMAVLVHVGHDQHGRIIGISLDMLPRWTSSHGAAFVVPSAINKTSIRTKANAEDLGFQNEEQTLGKESPLSASDRTFSKSIHPVGYPRFSN